jgi:phenylpyruvate tautomerase PptA (4-oxalocrotonate tautomerase family)
VKKPEPVEGLVIRYDYLWKDEHQKGRIEGQKDRPCAIVMAAYTQGSETRRVIIVPITHTRPRKATDAIEIPHKIKKHLGLDDERSWVVINEVNRVSWDDGGINPAIPGERWEYGALPQSFVKQIQDRIRERAQERQLGMVDREKIEKERDDWDRGR